MSQYVDDQLTRRAMIANERWCRDRGLIADQPANSSGLVQVGGQQYVHLYNARGTLAVYAVFQSWSSAPRISRLPDAEWPDEFRLEP